MESILQGKKDLNAADRLLSNIKDKSTAIHNLGAKPRENLLLNWDFRNPVNRNGQTEYSKEFTIDQWYLADFGASPVLSVNQNNIKVTINDTTGYTNFFQQLPIDSIYQGNITASAILKGKVKIVIGIITGEQEIYFGTETITSESFSLFELQSELPENYSYIDFYLQIYDTTEIIATKLELGTEQTLAHQDENNNWVINEPSNYDYQYALCSQYGASTKKWVGNQHSNPNLLDNWYFADPINQRGQTEYMGQVYTIDRWAVYRNESGNVAVTSSGVQLDGDFDWGEPIEELRLPKTDSFDITISVLTAEGKLFTGTKTINNTILNDFIEVSTGDGSYLYFINKWNSDSVALFFLKRLGGTITPIAAKLELGPVQTLAHQNADGNWVLNDPPPNKALELAKCQRYQLALNPMQKTYGLIGIGHAATVNTAYVWVYPPVSMRSTPTFTYNDLSNFCIRGSGATRTGIITGIYVDSASTKGFVLLCLTSDSAFTAGETFDFFTSNAETPFLDNNL